MDARSDGALTGYKLFRSWVAQQKISLVHNGEKDWVYYDFGPKDSKCVLLMLPGISGTGDVFYRLFLSLCPKGYRLISVKWPPYFSHHEWVAGFDRFLDSLNLQKVHLLGTGLGGFLAQLYTQSKPYRVLSLILNNTFSDTTYFSASLPCAPSTLSYLPEFYLKRTLLANFPTEELPNAVADSVDFMVEQLESMSQPDVASRIALNCTPRSIGDVRIMSSNVTLINVADDDATPQELAHELKLKYPGARQADIRQGGNYPYIAAYEDFALHTEVHLRSYLKKVQEEIDAAQGN